MYSQSHPPQPCRTFSYISDLPLLIASSLLNKFSELSNKELVKYSLTLLSIVGSPLASAVGCSTADSANNIVLSSCSDLTWSNGNLRVGSGVSLTAESNAYSLVSASSNLGGLDNFGAIGSYVNSGDLKAVSVGSDTFSIYNEIGSSINSFQNSGNSSSSDFGLYNRGVVGVVNNTGTLNGIYSAVYNEWQGNINNFVNNGLITATDPDNPAPIVVYGSIGNLTNNSQIISPDSNTTTYGIQIRNATNPTVIGNVNSLTNYGTIYSGFAGGVFSGFASSAILNDGNIGTLKNAASGVIASGGTFISLYALYYDPAVYSMLAPFSSAILNMDGGTINSINNLGAIYINPNGSPYASLGYSSVGFGIYNYGSIGSLSNAQGGNGQTPQTTALIYGGNLPNSYNAIISNPSHYGQLSAQYVSGKMIFGIDPSSILSAGTYTEVLSGISYTNFLNSNNYNTWYNFGSSYKWELVPEGNFSTASIWDLIVASLATNITSGNTYQSSNLGTTVNPVFDGGTLQVSNAGRITQAFTITANNGIIDQHSLTSNFTGAITDSAAGVHGKLTIVNSGSGGSVILSGINTYSGGTQVDAGANLSISSANNIGTGTLALVGSSSTPATLTTTANMTIANPITVAGDPVFHVALGTTTTVSSPITNGGIAGDVVVAGGGTLNLAAVNTYTGLTAVGTGSTLALSGNGSIATSSGLTNNGTFNITGKTGNVSVVHYTQGAKGTLAMNLAPSNTQQLNVAGTAALAGTLSLTAGAGAYTSGKYTLLTANGVSGTFGSLSTNLSSYTRLGYGLSYDANDVYLVFTPNSADTQQSLVNSSQALQSTYTLQNSVLANSFSYDCNDFGEHGICISAGGRNTAVSAANGLNNTSALLIAAYKVHPQVRIGAYADQNLSMNNAGGTVNLGNNTPLIGLFGAWNERLDGTGTEIKVSGAYGQKNTTITRQVVNTSESGTGSSTLKSEGAQLTVKYGFKVVDNAILAPYVGLRYTLNNMPGYAEGTSSAVTTPLTYYALNTNATTALAGLGASYRFIPKATVFASAGVESDTNTTNGTYTAFGVSGLTPTNFNANPVKTRPTATLGAYYDLEKFQRVGITGIYRQEPYQGVATTTVMATYTVGL